MDHLSNPPKGADRFLRWFCKEELHEEVVGDLHEFYDLELQALPAWKAKLIYWYHIIHFLRPFALRQRLFNLNHLTMYQNHFKFAWRNMLKHRGSAALNILTLGLGIGCFLFIFIYLKGELSYDRFHREVDDVYRIVIDIVNDKGERLPDATTPPALAPNLKKDFAEVGSSVRVFPNWGGNFLLGPSDDKKFYEEEVVRTDSTFFDVFSFPMLYGDPNTALDDRSSIVLTENSAIKYFGRTDVLGEDLFLFRGNDRVAYKVTAVLENVPANSHFKFDVLARLTFRNLDQNWGWYNYYTYIRMAEGAQMASLEPKLQDFFEGYISPREHYNIIYSQPIKDIHLKSNLKWELEPNGDINNVYILSLLALFVLIISCLNYLNLIVADSLKRFREVGVRKVLGANKPYLIGQFLAETLLVSVLALALGTFLAELFFRNAGDLLGRPISIFTPENLPFYLGLCGAVLLIGIIAGIYPALQMSSFRPALAVKGLINSSGKSSLRLRRALMVVQFAISAFMIFSTIGVYRQIQHMNSTDKGYSAEQVLVIDNLRNIPNQAAFRSELLKVPGIKFAGMSDGLVGGQNWTTRLGYPDNILINYLAVDPEYMDALDFELVKGRNFSRSRPSDSIDVTVIVNETGLRELGISMDDVGKNIPIFQRSDTSEITRGTVIGVVKDFHFAEFRREIKPFCFFFGSSPLDFMNVQLASNNVNASLQAIEGKWNQFANGAPFEYSFLDENFADLHAKESRLSKILFFLSGLAIFIAFMGMFASASINIKARKKEISIRKVLGASVSGVTMLITRNFLLLVFVANLIAIPISYWVLQNWLEGFAYRTGIGWAIFFITLISTLLVAILTVGSQSFWAALSNPVKHLRGE